MVSRTADKGHGSVPAAQRLLLTSVSAVVAETATYPIDLVKTRLQLQGELSAAHLASSASPSAQPPKRLGAFSMAASIVRTEGLRGLYAGLAPAAVRHVFYSGTRITVYESLREWTRERLGTERASVLGVALLLGMVSGAAGQAVAVPADLVKVRMQADGRLVATGALAQPRYKGLLDATRQILASEGGAGLWRGASPAIQRAALVNLGELATYDSAKQALLRSGVVEEGPFAAAGASLCSGFVAAVVSTPADVVKTRLMNQNHARPLYRGTLDCLVQCARAEGIGGLYKGFWPTWARLGPWQLVFWSTYERARVLSGMGSF